MIFVTVGSTDFDTLVRQMDAIATQLGEEITMQIGSGQYEPLNATTFFRYAPTLDPYMEEADLVVSHGGLGTVMEALRMGKRLVAVSNPDRYDSHQDDLLSHLSDAGHLIWCRDLATLEQDLRRVRSAHFEPYAEVECRIHVEIKDFLRRRFPRAQRA